MKNIYLGKAINRFLLILIAIGILGNLFINNTYLRGWTIGEWLISYSGGFVRRGISGTILFQISKYLNIEPKFIIFLICIIAYAYFAFIILNFCRNKFDKSFLLSPFILSGPIIGNYLLKKDIFLVCIFGLNLFILNFLFKQKIKYKLISFLFTNILSIFAILTHEAYFFIAVPILFTILFFEFDNINKLDMRKISFYFLLISPTIFCFFITLIFKGSLVEASKIISSWRELIYLFPSLEELSLNGAIESLGWTTRLGLTKSYNTFFDVSFFAWHPLAWLITIYLGANLFIGKHEKELIYSKRTIVFFQFLSISPLFFLGNDFGRWIFLWISSSTFLIGFIDNFRLRLKIIDLDNFFNQIFRINMFLPGIVIKEYRKYLILILAVPTVGWSWNIYFLSTPLGFFIRIIQKILSFV